MTIGQPPSSGYSSVDNDWLNGLAGGHNLSFLSGLTALGTNQATALQLPDRVANIQIDSSAAGSGVAMPSAISGVRIFVGNNTANNIIAYPSIRNNNFTQAQDVFVGGAPSFTISAGSGGTFVCAKNGIWFPATGSSSLLASVSFNITAANTSKFTSTFRAATRNTNVAFTGDSTMRGVNESSILYNAQYAAGAMPMQIAAMLNSSAIPAGANNWYGESGFNLNDYLIRDSRLTTTGSTIVGGSQCQGGASLQFSSAGTIAFANLYPCNTADIYWRDTGARSWSWQVDGGGATTVSASLNQITKTTIALGAVGIHTVTLNWVSGGVDIYGIDCYDNTRNEIHLLQWGTSGATSGSLIANTGAPNAGRLQQIASFPPDLMISEGGVVNDWRTSVTVASTIANLTALVQSVVAAGGNFIFLTPPFDNGTAGFTANQNAYVQAMYQVAAAQGVGLIDIRKAPGWGSWASAVTAGYQSAADNVHPTFSGYANQAQIISQLLLNLR